MKINCDRCKRRINKTNAHTGCFGYSILCDLCKNLLDPNMKGVRNVIHESLPADVTIQPQIGSYDK